MHMTDADVKLWKGPLHFKHLQEFQSRWNAFHSSAPEPSRYKEPDPECNPLSH